MKSHGEGTLTLMGVRLYNPVTGRFLSVDPVPGGTDNPYVYVLNPTDQFDLNGQWGHWRRWSRWTWHATAEITNWRGVSNAFRTSYRHVNVSTGFCAWECYSVGFQHGHGYWNSGTRGFATIGVNLGWNRGYSTSTSYSLGGGVGWGGYAALGGSGSWRNRVLNGEVGVSWRPGGCWGGRGRNHTIW